MALLTLNQETNSAMVTLYILHNGAYMTSLTSKIEYDKFASLLLESMADGVFTVDKNDKISSWNPSMERITGYTAEEAIGET